MAGCVTTINNAHVIQYVALNNNKIVDVVKGRKACYERLLKNKSPSNEPLSTQFYLRSERLTEVDATSYKCN